LVTSLEDNFFFPNPLCSGRQKKTLIWRVLEEVVIARSHLRQPEASTGLQQSCSPYFWINLWGKAGQIRLLLYISNSAARHGNSCLQFQHYEVENRRITSSRPAWARLCLCLQTPKRFYLIFKQHFAVYKVLKFLKKTFHFGKLQRIFTTELWGGASRTTVLLYS
jgi:hypothetical protein